MDLPKIEDLISCGDPEYLETLSRQLNRAGFGSSGVFVEGLTPSEALTLGKREGPHAGTRQVACEDPYYAHQYARYVDQGPRNDTRQAACEDPIMAYNYARYVDKGPREDTRQAACGRPTLATCPGRPWQRPTLAYNYAQYVDQRFHEGT